MAIENLTGYTLVELEAFAERLGEKRFRGRQLFGWIYNKKASRFAEMTDLAKSFRAKLESVALLGHLEPVEKAASSSQSVKYLFQLTDGQLIESVYIPESGRRTLCISSQVGCAVKCAFCATGKMGFRRHLSAGEIVDQVLWVSRDTGQPMTNVVFMGMGEPFLNYDQVIKAAQLISHEQGIAIGHRHVVISTSGIVPNVYRYADEGHKFRLAISLNSPHQEQRAEIMPISQKYTIRALVEAAIYFYKKSRRLPTFEYVLLAGLNDREEDALALRKLLHGVPCKVNLIPYNPTVEEFARPDSKRIERFAESLYPLKAPVSVRWSKGADIDAACGQLAGRHLKIQSKP
jgi:23S rRNA (adenine2503-C2)-methyltransferase